MQPSPITDFVDTIGVWVDELQVNKLLNAPFFSLMADDCTDIVTVDELSFFIIGRKMDHLWNIA